MNPRAKIACVCVALGAISLMPSDAGETYYVATEVGHSQFVSCAAVSPDERLVVSGSVDGSVKVWDLLTSKEMSTWIADPGAVRLVTWCEDGQRVASYGSDGLKLWEARSGRLVRSWRDHLGVLSISPDCRLVLSSQDGDATLRLWDIEAGKEVRSVSGHVLVERPCANESNHNKCLVGVESAVISADGSEIASGGADGTVRIWDLASGNQLVSCLINN